MQILYDINCSESIIFYLFVYEICQGFVSCVLSLIIRRALTGVFYSNCDNTTLLQCNTIQTYYKFILS